jgi:RsiW-degrading membrane proteinase PrsW (M82 family)
MAFPSPFAQPPHAPGAPVAPAATPGSLRPPTSPRSGQSAPVWLFAVLVVLAFGVVTYVVSFLGVAAAAVGMLLALIPLVGVLFAVRLVDRWEPEPTSLVVAALLWGGVAAVAIALLVDLAVGPVLGVLAPESADAVSSVVQAPIVEEIAKGLGVLVIFFFGRRAFDGPVDGVVYGALVGAGFAFTENILYFATSLIEGGVGEVTFTFLLRGVLSPFAHVIFTAVTGFAVGIAARSGRPVGGRWLLGLGGAIALHALWNGSAVFADFFALYVTLQVPLFLGFVLGVVLLRREEARLTRARLGEYAAAGWFTAAEIDMVATPRGRRAAVAWARSFAGDRSRQMKEFIFAATSLAAARQRSITGRDRRSAELEHIMLGRAVAARSALLSAQPSRTG